MLFGDDDQDWGGEVDIRRDGFVACDGPDMLTITRKTLQSNSCHFHLPVAACNLAA